MTLGIRTLYQTLVSLLSAAGKRPATSDPTRENVMDNTEKDIRCPKCAALMTFQGIKSVGVGANRLFNVGLYLCSKCGCKGRYDEMVQKIVEIHD